jgi:hypothetical protein
MAMSFPVSKEKIHGSTDNGESEESLPGNTPFLLSAGDGDTPQRRKRGFFHFLDSNRFRGGCQNISPSLAGEMTPIEDQKDTVNVTFRLAAAGTAALEFAIKRGRRAGGR